MSLADSQAENRPLGIVDAFDAAKYLVVPDNLAFAAALLPADGLRNPGLNHGKCPRRLSLERGQERGERRGHQLLQRELLRWRYIHRFLGGGANRGTVLLQVQIRSEVLGPAACGAMRR